MAFEFERRKCIPERSKAVRSVGCKADSSRGQVILILKADMLCIATKIMRSNLYRGMKTFHQRNEGIPKAHEIVVA